jgi:L-rhamnose isomerase
VTDLTNAFRDLVIETPSWGYGDSGTRFGVFPQAGRPRDVYEKLDDAAEVHRLTATAGAVALHFPWDAVDDYAELRREIEARGLRVGAVNPNLFQDPGYKLGSLTHPDADVREKAVEHMLECLRIATALGSSAQSLCGSPTAPTTRVRTTCARAGAGCSTRLCASTPSCRPSRSCWSSTSSSSRRSTRPTWRTGAARC